MNSHNPQSQFEDVALELAPRLREAYLDTLAHSRALEDENILENFSSWLEPWLAEQGERRSPDPWAAWDAWVETKIKPALRRMGPKAQQTLNALQEGSDPATEEQIIALALCISILLQVEQPSPSNLLLISLALIRRKSR